MDALIDKTAYKKSILPHGHNTVYTFATAAGTRFLHHEPLSLYSRHRKGAGQFPWCPSQASISALGGTDTRGPQTGMSRRAL